MQEEHAVLSDKVQTPALVEPRGRVSVIEGLKQALMNAALRHYYFTGERDLFKEGIQLGGQGAAVKKAKEPGGKQEVLPGQGAET